MFQITEIKESVEGAKTSDSLQDEIEKSFREIKVTPASFRRLDSRCSDMSYTPLAINRRESFFNDSFFENDRHHFNKSIQDILDRRSTRLGSSNEVALKVREAEMTDAQASSFTDEDQCYKVGIK